MKKTTKKTSWFLFFLVLLLFLPVVSADTTRTNSATGLSCTALCAVYGQACASIGDNIAANDGNWHYDVLSCGINFGGTCATVMTNDGGGPCGTFPSLPTRWTKCKCTGDADSAPSVTAARFNETSPVLNETNVKINATVTHTNGASNISLVWVELTFPGESPYNLTMASGVDDEFFVDINVNVTAGDLTATIYANSTTAGVVGSDTAQDQDNNNYLSFGNAPVLNGAYVNGSNLVYNTNVSVNVTVTDLDDDIINVTFEFDPPSSEPFNLTATNFSATGWMVYHVFNESGVWNITAYAEDDTGFLESLIANDTEDNPYVLVQLESPNEFNWTFPDGYNSCIFNFNFSLTEELNVNCSGQNATTPFYTITNNGSSNLNLDAIFNSNIFSNYSVTWSLTNNTDDANDIEGYTEYFRIKEDVAPDDVIEIWMFANRSGTIPNKTITYQMNLSALCGNLVVENTEDCDDGNFINGDGCSDICLGECGNGIVDEEAGESCDDGGQDNGDGCDENCTVECEYFPSFANQTYGYYFACHPLVKNLTWNTLSSVEKTYFDTFHTEINNTGFITIDDPAELPPLNSTEAECNSSSNCWGVTLTEDETSKYVTAHMAQNVWHDKNETFTWSLEDNFTTSQLAFLWRRERPANSGVALFDGYSGDTGALAYISDHDPPMVYNYTKVLLNESMNETVFNMIRDVRGNLTDTYPDRVYFYHSQIADGVFGYLAYSAIVSLTNLSIGNIPTARMATHGSWGMARILASMSRSVGLPVELTYSGSWLDPLPWGQNFTGPYDSGAARQSIDWTTAEQILIYGDDIYNSNMLGLEPEELLMPYSYWYDNWNGSICGGWVLNYTCNKPSDYGEICTNGTIDLAPYISGTSPLDILNRRCVAARYDRYERELKHPQGATITECCDAVNEISYLSGQNYTDCFEWINHTTMAYFSNHGWFNVINTTEMEEVNATIMALC